MTTLVRSREALAAVRLDVGAHPSPDKGLCLLEACAWAAGEMHGDHPACVSLFLGAFGRRLNDLLPDGPRQRLNPFIERMVGTAGDGLDDVRRHMAVDWAARTAVPRYLDVAGMAGAAQQLRDLAPVVDKATHRAARKALADVRAVTWSMRQARRAKLRDLFIVEFKKNPPTTVAAAAAAAAAAAVAVAAAVDVDAAAVVAAAVAVVADAAVAVAVAAAVDVDAAAAAAAAVDVAAEWPSWGQVYDAVRRALREKWSDASNTGALAEVIRLNQSGAIDLFDRMIDTSAVKMVSS